MVAVSEARRFRLYVRLVETLGPEPAATLMELLPRSGYVDLEAEVAALRRRVEGLERELSRRSLV